MLLFFRQMFLTRARACVYVCVVHWHCTAQLSMFNMEKRFKNKIIIIIIIIIITVICQSGLSYRFFADDSQLHKSSVPSDFPVLACCLKNCIEDVAEWMGDSKLKMNDDKTELMAIGTTSKLSQVIPNLTSRSISGCDIPFSYFILLLCLLIPCGTKGRNCTPLANSILAGPL